MLHVLAKYRTICPSCIADDALGDLRSTSKNKNTVVAKVKSMQRPGIEAIRTEIETSKPKREITNKNSPNTKRTYGQPSEANVPIPNKYVRRACFRIIEPRHEKTNILHMRKQRRRSASR